MIDWLPGVAEMLKSGVGGAPHPGNLNDAMRVLQLKEPFEGMYSGAYVPCWKMLRLLPPAVRSSYQRMPTELPTVTLRLITSASWSPKLRYARRYMRRSPSVSSFWLVPDCGTQVPPPPLHGGVNAAVASVVGPVSVVLAGVVQSV